MWPYFTEIPYVRTIVWVLDLLHHFRHCYKCVFGELFVRFGGSNDFLEAKLHGGCIFVEDLFQIQ